MSRARELTALNKQRQDATARGLDLAHELVSEAAVSDTEVVRDELRTVLDEVGPRLKGLKEDPEVQGLAKAPEIMAMLESGDTLGLIRHPGIRRVASRVAQGPAGES